MNKSILALVAASAFSGAVVAQTIAGLTVDVPQAQAGQAVTATVKFDNADSPNCGLRFYWGDGATEDIKVVDTKQNPLVLKHTYAKPGAYELMAEGKKVTSHLKCQGANARAKLTVAASPAAAKPAASAAAPAGPQCPQGWKLDAKSVNKKTGAFTCTAKAGTALPEKKLSCAGDTGYFENGKKGQLGCRI
jgi:hypothetical protein